MTAPRLVTGVAVSLIVVTTSCRGDDTDSAADPTTSTVTESTGTSSSSSSPVATDEGTATTAGSTEPAGTSAATTTSITITTTPPSTGTRATTTTAATTGITTTTAAAPATSTTAATTTTTVPTWTSPTGDYSVAFGDEPGVFELPSPVEDVDIPVTLFAVETDDYAVLSSRTDYADYGVAAADIDIEAARDLAVDRAAGVLTASEDVTVQGRDGVRFQFVIGDPQEGVGDGMLLLDGTVLYQVAGIGVTAEQPFLSAFVDSFTFTEDR